MAYPSTFSDLQNIVIAKLRLDSINDLTKVKDAINAVYAQACLETDLNVNGTVTQTLTANQSSYTLDPNVVRIKEMTTTPVGSTVSAPLQLTSLDYILRRRQASAGTSPNVGYVTHYALVGLNDLELYPTPQSADTLTIYCTKAPTVLSNGTDVPILPEPFASKVLEYGTLAEMADLKGDPSEQEYRGLYEDWKARLRAHLNRRRGAQPGQFQIWNGQVFPPHDPSTDTGSGY